MGKWVLPGAVIIALLFLLIAGSGPGGRPRSGCASDSDCPANSSRFCAANGSACLETTIVRV